jgi:methanogenic corrinoid protein MtbC1
MNAFNDLAAEMLEASAAGYAAAAMSLLYPAGTAPPPAIEGATWKNHLTQRVLELAAAVRVAQPALFERRVHWLRRAARARGAGERELQRALLSLRSALERELPDNLKPAVAPALDLAVAAFDDPLAARPAALDAGRSRDRLALRYLALCLEGKPADAMALVLHELENGFPAASVYTEVLVPAEKEIGELWHGGDISIAEEHLVSETTRELMALIVARSAPAEPRGPALIAASITGNAHDIGLRAAADLFRLAGWRCLYLGANVPAADLGRAAESFAVDLVLLNATLTTQLKALADAVEAVRRVAPRRKILVGGLAFDGVPDLWRELGADAYAPTIDAAVGIGAALVARS